MAAFKKKLVISVAALGADFVKGKIPPKGVEAWRSLEPPFPSLTCVSQATFRTAAPPARHGVVSNGLFFSDLKKVLFWEQSAALVEGPRIWDSFRAQGKTVGMMFWQQSLGEEVDLVLSPKPVHKHDGGMMQDCYSQPSDLYERITAEIGRPFNLMHYWGPFASYKSSAWITDATKVVMADAELAPDLLLTYLPHLDYDLQRFGPESPQAEKAWATLCRMLEDLIQHAQATGYEVVIFGDYGIGAVQGEAVYPNRALFEAALFYTRDVKGMGYPDLFNGKAFAVVDHEVAHVFCKDDASIERARKILSQLDGVAEVFDRSVLPNLNHPRSGDLIIVAEAGRWFAYPWWSDKNVAPDFASHIDIHNKPGYDPCELFMGPPNFKNWPPLSVSQNTARIKGSHGRGGVMSAWWSSFLDGEEVNQLQELAEQVKCRCS